MTWRVDVQTSNGEAGRSNGYVTHWCETQAEADALAVRLATRTNPAVAWDWEPTEPWAEEKAAKAAQACEDRRERLGRVWTGANANDVITGPQNAADGLRMIDYRRKP